MANIEFSEHEALLNRLATHRGNAGNAGQLLEIAGIMQQLHTLKGELVASVATQDEEELEDRSDRTVEKLMAVLGLQPSS